MVDKNWKNVALDIFDRLTSEERKKIAKALEEIQNALWMGENFEINVECGDNKKSKDCPEPPPVIAVEEKNFITITDVQEFQDGSAAFLMRMDRSTMKSFAATGILKVLMDEIVGETARR